MAQKYRANIFKKLRRWIGKRVESTMTVSGRRSVLSGQVGNLMRNRGSEIITMTTL